jgi:alpha-ribazole phosphatase
VVAHGGPLRVLAGHLLGLPPERWIGLDFGCGQVTRIDVESWGTVLKWFNR